MVRGGELAHPRKQEEDYQHSSIPISADLVIDLRASITAAPNEWTPERVAKLADWLKANDVSVVFLDAEPGPALLDTLKGYGLVRLSTVEGDEPAIVAAVERNIGSVRAAFQPR
ncbi:hypothetical protein [Shinella sp.]|uniref:hypothetical protein n=1 Tax=Shinella sp. TaxID=1870904 RepID=UPI0039E3D350